MAPEYRVVAINELDDDSTGVSLSWFADPDALKVAFPAYPDDEAFVTSAWDTTGITVGAAIEDGDGSLPREYRSLTVEFHRPSFSGGFRTGAPAFRISFLP